MGINVPGTRDSSHHRRLSFRHQRSDFSLDNQVLFWQFNQTNKGGSMILGIIIGLAIVAGLEYWTPPSERLFRRRK